MQMHADACMSVCVCAYMCMYVYVFTRQWSRKDSHTGSSCAISSCTNVCAKESQSESEIKREIHSTAQQYATQNKKCWHSHRCQCQHFFTSGHAAVAYYRNKQHTCSNKHIAAACMKTSAQAFSPDEMGWDVTDLRASSSFIAPLWRWQGNNVDVLVGNTGVVKKT